MSEKIEQCQKELDDLTESINLNYEKMSRAGNDYYNEIRRYLEKASESVDVVYDKGLNDAWEYIKELYALTPNERRKIFSFPHILSIINNFTPMDVINKIDQYEKVTRRSIIKTKLDEIKGMFEDPVTNEELIEILNEEKDDVINY